MISEKLPKKSSKSGQKIDANANDALGCSKRCWSDRLTMPHDHCFVGSTKKVISSHLRAAAGGEDDQGRPSKGGQHGKKRGEKEEETSRVKKHENIPRKIDRELLACCFVGQPARRKLARTDGRMALTGARRFDQRWNHRPSAPTTAIMTRSLFGEGTQAIGGSQTSSYLDSPQLVRLGNLISDAIVGWDPNISGMPGKITMARCSLPTT